MGQPAITDRFMTYQTMIKKLADFFAAQELDVFLVGGFVRNLVLSRPQDRDIDLAVGGDAAAIAADLATVLGGALVPLSLERSMMRIVVPANDDAPDSPFSDYSGGQAGNEAGGHAGAWTIDLTGFSGGIEEDLARRDFSVNAMAVALSSWEEWASLDALIDPLGGRADLARKCIRALGPGIFESDPGRLLRAMRLSSQLRFRLEPETVRLLASESHRLAQVSPDRVREEFFRILSLDGAKAQLEAMDRLGLFQQIIPELQAAKGVDQPRMHYWDVWGHTLHAVETAELVTKGHRHSPIYSCVPWTAESEEYFNQPATDGYSRGTVLKLAALFHDVAKPQTKTTDESGRTRFFGHSEQGAEIATNRLKELHVSSRGINMVAKMVEQHLRPTNMMDGDDWPTNRAIHRYFRDVDDVAIDTLYLCLADYLAAKGPELSHSDWLNHARMVAHILHVGTNEPVSPTTTRLVTGHDLMTHFNLKPGPYIGSLLEDIEEARAAGEIETQGQALELAAQALLHRGDSD